MKFRDDLFQLIHVCTIGLLHIYKFCHSRMRNFTRASYAYEGTLPWFCATCKPVKPAHAAHTRWWSRALQGSDAANALPFPDAGFKTCRTGFCPSLHPYRLEILWNLRFDVVLIVNRTCEAHTVSFIAVTRHHQFGFRAHVPDVLHQLLPVRMS